MNAVEYTKALYSLSEERGNTDTVLSDMNTVSQVLLQSPRYVTLLDTPALSMKEKEELIDSAFAAVADEVRIFIKVLAGKHAVHLFTEAARRFHALYDEEHGILRVEAVSAVAMTQGQRAAMTEKLSAITGKTIVLKNTVEPEILGGVRLRYGDYQLDGSVRTRLDDLGAVLKATVIG